MQRRTPHSEKMESKHHLARSWFRHIHFLGSNPRDTSVMEYKEQYKEIGAHIGHVLEVDLVGEPGGSWKKFIRIWVDIPILKPLNPSFFQPRPNKTDFWIGFKYEKLADCCYRWGIIGHEEKSCELNLFQLRNPEGIWLKAAGPWLNLGNLGNDDYLLDVYFSNEDPLNTTMSVGPLPAQNPMKAKNPLLTTLPRIHTTLYCTTQLPT